MLTLLWSCGKQASEDAVLLKGDQFDRVRTLIHDTMKRRSIASMTVAVSKDGKIIWEESFGWADREKKIKATPDTIYPIASISKAMTATGLMVLSDHGRVDIDKPANDYLGEAKLVAYLGKDSDATVRRVMQHTAGLPMYWNLYFEKEKSRPPDIDESIKRYGILVTEPGEVYEYSNLGYGIIDHLISRLSQKSYEEFMRTEVFEPLGMVQTSVLIDPSQKENVAQLYDELQSPFPFWDCDHRGASSIFSSARDLIRFGMFHLKHLSSDQSQILSDATIDAMHKPTGISMPDVNIGAVEIGLGWAIVDLYGHRFLSATGGAPGVSCRLGLAPSENIAVAILCNSGISDSAEIWNLWYIEWSIYAALIPKLPKGIDIPLKKEAYAPPDALEGEWKGMIKTHIGDLPVRMHFEKKEGVSLSVNGKSVHPIDVENPLGIISFKNGIFQGPFFGGVGTEDTKRAPNVLFLHMRLRGNKLNGYAAAIAMNQKFCLPYWIELTKEESGMDK